MNVFRFRMRFEFSCPRNLSIPDSDDHPTWIAQKKIVAIASPVSECAYAILELAEKSRYASGSESLGSDSLGSDSLGSESLENDSLGNDSLGDGACQQIDRQAACGDNGALAALMPIGRLIARFADEQAEKNLPSKTRKRVKQPGGDFAK